MKKEQILKKVIEKVVKNGWDSKAWLDVSTIFLKEEISSGLYNDIIFDHSFAKAFASYIMDSGQGEKLMYLKDNGRAFELCDFIEAFKIELVLSKDRLEYISKFI